MKKWAGNLSHLPWLQHPRWRARLSTPTQENCGTHSSERSSWPCRVGNSSSRTKPEEMWPVRRVETGEGQSGIKILLVLFHEAWPTVVSASDRAWWLGNDRRWRAWTLQDGSKRQDSMSTDYHICRNIGTPIHGQSACRTGESIEIRSGCPRSS